MVQEDTSYFFPLEGVNTPQANRMTSTTAAATAAAMMPRAIFVRFFMAFTSFSVSRIQYNTKRKKRRKNGAFGRF